MGRKKKLELTNNVQGLCSAHNMTLRSLAKCVKQVGYSGVELHIIYSALLRFAHMDNPERINVKMLLCLCEVFGVGIESIIKRK